MTHKKAALITGASKRIGLMCARTCAALGYDIALHYFSGKDEAEAAKKDIEKTWKVRVELISCDLSDPNGIEPFFTTVHTHFPIINLLINSASSFEKTRIVSETSGTVIQQLSLNIIAPILLTKEFSKLVGEGSIINITDAKKHHPERSIYNTSKYALEAFTEQAAKELAPTIRVNAIALGSFLPPVQSSSCHSLEGRDPENLELNSSVLKDDVYIDTPLNRSGTENDLKEAIRFLIHSTYITGEILHIDGGRHLR